MKKICYCLLLICITLTLFTACKKDEGVTGDYSAGYKAWKKFKSSVKDSYEYAVVEHSWTGYSTETIITVQNGKVTQRAFLAKTINGATGAA
ncbi:MAG: hypothetical protein EOO07_23980, partial [Chitinophagaceae bacterium]